MSIVKSILSAIKPFIGQSRKQRALVVSLISLTLLMLPFVAAKPPPPPPPVTSVSLVCCTVNPNTITIAPGGTGTLLLNEPLTISSGSAEQFIPVSVTGNFSSTSPTSFTVIWTFNSTVIISAPSFATSTPSEQTIGPGIASFLATSFLVASHPGPATYVVNVTIQNGSGSTLFVKNSFATLAIALS